MKIPSSIYVGDTVQWRDDPGRDYFGNAVTSADWTLTYYLRFNRAGEGLTVVGTSYGSGWQFTISAATSATLTAGDAGHWQARATKGSESYTFGSGNINVLAGLNYSGTPGAYDGRTQTEQDLDAVNAAIRAMISGGAVQEYTIGNRQLRKMSMADLLQLQGLLNARVQRDLAAESIANGLGNPRNMFVRFW